MPELLCLGLGYSAQALARRLAAAGWRVSGTARAPERAAELAEGGFDAFLFRGDGSDAEVAARIARATHLLVSAPPDKGSDPVLAHFDGEIAAAPRLAWIGYLSTIGVYGDQQGRWVDETAPLNAAQARSRDRIAAEQAWLALGARAGKAVQVFRLAGIYGPGRSAVDQLRSGRARRVVKPGQIFNRIHVEDVAAVLEASIRLPNAGAVYNVGDDEPAPGEDVIAYGARLLGMEPPPEVPFEEAGLTPMARSFYGENKRVVNARIKHELGVELAYPTYRDGLRAIAGLASCGSRQ